MDAWAPLPEINWSEAAHLASDILRFSGGSNVQSASVEKNHCAREIKKKDLHKSSLEFMGTMR